MKNTVIKTIRTHNLIQKNSKVMVALSGGSDSVCLLHILNDIKDTFGFELYACHMNHSIRKEADDDCRFVTDLCEKLGIVCFIKKVDIKAVAREKKISEELAGRNERYSFFKDISEKNNIDIIATAHNKNDAAETILMHIIRGCGIDGMKGIAYKRDNIIRPLLDAEKSDIEKYCKDNGYDFVIDKTNSQSIYTRNKIRLELIPEICRNFNPAFINTVVKNAEIIKDDAEYLNGQAEKAYNRAYAGNGLMIDKLKTLHISVLRRVVLIMYNKYFGNTVNMQSVHVESIVRLIKNGQSGKSVNIDNNTKCIIESGKVFLTSSQKTENHYEYKLELNQKIYIKECGISVTLKEWEGNGEKFYFEDTDCIYVRNRKKGDIFYPVGMTGKKKLSDYFTDEKIPLSERNKIPLIIYNNDLVWIVKKRRDRRFTKGDKAYMFVIE